MALQHSPSIVTSGLVLCLDPSSPRSYSGSGTKCYDASGTGNAGTLTNGVGYNTSNLGRFVFDGVDDYINAGTFFNYNFFTISLWVYPGTSQVTYADIFDNYHTGTQNFVCQQNGDSLNQYNFACINATNASATSVFTLTANTWHNLVCLWNNSTASAYINGTLHSTGAAANPINYVTPNFNLGSWGFGGRNWNGSMSQVLVYNRTLSSTEIQQNFNALRGRYGI